MTAINVLKALVPPSFKSLLKQAMGFKTMENRLQNLRHARFECTGAIDVGAYHGEWSKNLRSVWNVPLIMVEPQTSCAPFLERFANRPGAPAAYLEQCALGKKAGSVEFVLEETNSRMVPNGQVAGAPTMQLPVKMLREIVSKYSEKLNLLKADVQGFELDVLEGAGGLLKQLRW